MEGTRLTSEAHEPHATFLGNRLCWFICSVCEKRFLLGAGLTPRPRACPWCGVTYTQFKNEAGEFEPL